MCFFDFSRSILVPPSDSYSTPIVTCKTNSNKVYVKLLIVPSFSRLLEKLFVDKRLYVNFTNS